MRFLHRFVSPWLFVLLLVTLITGITYRIGRAWFGMSSETGHAILDFHTGEWLGESGSTIYVLVVGGGLLLLTATGLVLLFKSRAKGGARVAHRVLGAILLLPLTASAVTGILYKVGEKWFGFSGATNDLMMTIHEGAWMGGKEIRPYYVLCIGLGLLALGLLGLRLLRRRG